MKRYSTRNESPRPFEVQADPDALPLPRAPDSRTFRLLLNGGDPYLQRVAELVRRLWIKQRPREDAEAVLAQVLEDLAEGRYALRHLAAYLSALPLVASPCRRLAEMIAGYYGLNADEPRAAGEDAEPQAARRAGLPAAQNERESRGGQSCPPRKTKESRAAGSLARRASPAPSEPNGTEPRGGSPDPPRQNPRFRPCGAGSRGGSGDPPR